jgi:prepilin-type N-terminal cleavage/methylation domain-containing protein
VLSSEFIQDDHYIEESMKKEAGFTLIEVIASLIIVGILTAVAGMGLVQVLRGYSTTRENARMSQQAQVAMSRIAKEIIELMDIPTASTVNTLYIKNIDGNRSLGLNTADNTIRINATGGAIAAGDILVEGVNAFTLTYWAGDPAVSSSTWTPGTNNIQQLKFIDVTLRLNRQDGGYLEFAVREAPRNNKNAGGTAPTSRPPAAPSYGCFVATAAYGNAYHPAVIALRDFRDRFLSSWEGGRSLIRLYQAHSPPLAETISEHPTAMVLARILLCPVIVFALFALYAPLTLWLFPITMLALSWIFPGSRRWKGKPRSLDGPRGTVLLSLLITIVIMGILSAAMLPIFSSSKLSQVYADQGAKAYFLAESGFRYSASIYLNAADDAAKYTALNNLNRKTCTLLNNDGSFSLIVYPYWYRTSNTPTGSTLTVGLPGEFDPAVSLPTTGYLKIGNTYYTYTASSGGTAGSTSLGFTGTWTGVTSGSDVYNVVLPSAGQTVTQKGNLTLSSTGVSVLPLINGNFMLDPAPTGTSSNTIYTYEKRNGTTLSGIDLADTSKPWTNLSLTTTGAIANVGTTKIVMSKYLRLSSTGTYGSTSKEIIYNVPIGWARGTEFAKKQYLNTFTGGDGSAPPNFHTTGMLGSLSIQSNALKITAMSQPSWYSTISAALINLNWGTTETNLGQAWLDAQGLLSYDVEVKVRDSHSTPVDGKYAIGILTKSKAVVVVGSNDLDCYGISFMRAQRQGLLGLVWSEFLDKIPDDIKPGGCCGNGGIWQQSPPGFGTQYSQPAIVLWQRVNGTFNWIAYKLTTYSAGSQNYIINSSNQLSVNWPTLLIRMVEGYPLTFSNGSNDGSGRHIKEGDTIKGATSGAKGRVDGTPVVSSGGWSSANATGTFSLANVSGTFQSNENLNIDGQGATVYAQATGAMGTGKYNYMRVYYSDTTAHGTANAIQTDNIRLANPLGSANWPPDDATDASASNDFFTLVQWTEVNTNVATSMPSMVEPGAGSPPGSPGAVIRSNALTSPAWSSSSTGSEVTETVSLSAFGANAANFSFDDFAIQLDLKTGSGFLPPIQQ